MSRAFFKWVAGTTIGVVLASIVVLATAPASIAANSADFQPGNIISDSVFFNKDAMSEPQIQAFLNAKEFECSSTCLKNYSQSTFSRGADAMCSTYSGAANESAARIIFKVAQACGINPQVILVTLQKEQGLVTSSNPSSWAWRSAMGYACPDSSGCDAQYNGFYNQVYNGARQYKRYGNPPGTSQYFTWYPVGGYANILYNPDPNCGSSSVYISNKATAALYYYTPYQPNVSALNAGYGSSPDSCASYGNRNFFFYFTDWFGSTGSVGPAMIDAAYAAYGGASGALGAPTTDYNSITSNGGGLVRGYANGAIAWSNPAGAFVITGSLRDYFNGLGGIAGSLGWPHSNANSFDANGGGSVQAFQNGAITQSNVTGTFTLSGRMRDAYNQSGSITGPLGWPATIQNCSSSTGVCTQRFQYGTIDLPPSGIAAITAPAMDSAYKAAGGATGPLGKPFTGVIANLSNGGGFVQAYEGGAIAWSAANGAHPISGAVRDYFNSQGGLTSYLGWPTGDVNCDASNTCSQTFVGGTVYVSENSGQSSSMASAIRGLFNTLGGSTGILGTPVGSTGTVSANGGGLVQGFTHGAITYTPSAGAVALTGDIRTVFGSLGGLSGSLGWPAGAASNYNSNGGGTVQGFQNGAIAKSPAGTFVLSGDIRSTYGQVGGIAGPFGWPTSMPLSTHGGLVQAFQNGAITWSPVVGAHPLSGTFRQEYATFGGIGGTLGWPAGDVVTSDAGGGGTVQRFDHGVITQKTGSATASVLVDGPIRDYFNQNGGLAGILGWPASSQTCTSTAVCSQSFDGGTLSWSSAGGVALQQ